MRKSRPFLMLSILFALVFGATYALAETAPISPVDFLGQVLQAILSFGGLSWMAKVSSVIMLIIASMKVSVLNQWIWSKLGAFQAWLAPILGLVAGVINVLVGGGNFASVLAFMTAGAGAIILHELLDTIKAIPGLGAFWVQIITGIEKYLGGPASLVPQLKK